MSKPPPSEMAFTMATNPGQVIELKQSRRILSGVFVKCVWECVNYWRLLWESGSDADSIYDEKLKFQVRKTEETD